MGVLLCAAAASPKTTPRRPVVAVMYFDNQTGDATLDVLQKGLADMMVTDLVGAGTVDVVERERLQALFNELNLQKSAWFEPSTALRLGKMVGSTHAVAGAFQQHEGRLRLSVRLIELQTGKVVLAEDVVGDSQQLFELQQRLVELLLGGLEQSQRGKAHPTPVGSVDSLLRYSQAVDLADTGQLTLAAARLAELIATRPELGLAADARVGIARRMRDARSARAHELEAARRALLQKADAVLAAGPPLVKQADLQAARTLTYRFIRTQLLGLAVSARLTPKPIHSVPKGAEAEVKALLGMVADNLAAFDANLAEWRSGFRWLPDPSDKAPLRLLELTPAPPGVLKGERGLVRQAEAALLLLGRLPISFEEPAPMRPALAELDPAWALRGLTAADDAVRLLRDESALSAADQKAQALLLLGRKADAVKLWQQLLELHPKSPRYGALEAQLKAALGLSTDAAKATKLERDLSSAIDACDATQLESIAGPAFETLTRRSGLYLLRPLADDALARCAGHPTAVKPLATQAVRWADELGDCAWFDRLLTAVARKSPLLSRELLEQHPGCATL